MVEPQDTGRDDSGRRDGEISRGSGTASRTNQRLLVFIGAVFVIGVAVMAYIGMTYGFGTPQSTSQPAPQPTTTSVVYEIVGTAKSVSITLSNPTGGTEQYGNAKVPQSITYSDFKSDFLYISAQNNGEQGSVTVTIYVNGQAVKTATSSGAYVIATASGSLR